MTVICPSKISKRTAFLQQARDTNNKAKAIALALLHRIIKNTNRYLPPPAPAELPAELPLPLLPVDVPFIPLFEFPLPELFELVPLVLPEPVFVFGFATLPLAVLLVLLLIVPAPLLNVPLVFTSSVPLPAGVCDDPLVPGAPTPTVPPVAVPFGNVFVGFCSEGF